MHKNRADVYSVGEAASAGIQGVAENGNVPGLVAELEGADGVGRVVTGSGPVLPGESQEFTFYAPANHRRVSVASMLICTNDGFTGLDSQRLPRWVGDSITKQFTAYDAGTEENDQSCANMPGPRCGAEGYSPVPGPGDEGFIHVSNGFHDLGDTDADGFEVLGPATYDWRNPVAQVTIKRKQDRDNSDSDD